MHCVLTGHIHKMITTVRLGNIKTDYFLISFSKPFLASRAPAAAWVDVSFCGRWIIWLKLTWFASFSATRPASFAPALASSVADPKIKISTKLRQETKPARHAHLSSL